MSSLLWTVAPLVALAAAELRFANSYGSNMVLQQAPKQAKVWGFGEPGAEVELQLTCQSNRHKAKAVVSSDGRWSAVLPATTGSMMNYTLSASAGTDHVELINILFGDVWVCSGQSNMAFLLEMDLNGTELVKDADNWPAIRLFTSKKIDSKTALAEQPSVEEPWAVGSSCSVSMNCGLRAAAAAGVGDDNWLYMSAVCWLFGREVQKQTGLPVGLVNTNWGGTRVEFWSSADAKAGCAAGSAGGAWNGMVSPLLNMTIQGAIWYQGEGNTGDSWAVDGPSGERLPLYACSFPAMISDWRRKWHQGTGGLTDEEFPFGFVQLAGWGTGLSAAGLRWAQTAGYGYVPNPAMPQTFMAVAVDLPDHDSPYGDVHIRHKQPLAWRLGLTGRALVYGERVAKTPRPLQAEMTGGAVAITFDAPLRLNGTSKAQFEVCQQEPCLLNSTTSWVNATASGSDEQVILQGVGDVSALRYAWSNVPCDYLACALYAKDALLPVAPFFMRVSKSAVV